MSDIDNPNGPGERPAGQPAAPSPPPSSLPEQSAEPLASTGPKPLSPAEPEPLVTASDAVLAMSTAPQSPLVATTDAQSSGAVIPPAPIPGRASDDADNRSARYLNPGDTPWAVTWRVLKARYQAVSDQVGRRIMQRTLKIGVSARIFHPESGATGLRSKTLQYLEESIAQWVMSRDVLVFMIPTVNNSGLLRPSNIRLRDYAKNLDGLVLQGGADVSPESYSEVATRPEWTGDRVRDMYELELLHEFIEAGKPVLGICRGCQLINVAFGGTLYQDIASDVPSAIEHVNDLYDSHSHVIHFPQGSSLAPMFQSHTNPLVNSIHHQAVKTLGRDLVVEAISDDDKIVEAIRYRKARFVMGLQWHPEFHHMGDGELLDCTPILDAFLRAARETRF